MTSRHPVGFTFEIERQPNDTTCGPTCLHALYRHYGLGIPFADLEEGITSLDEGGTLAVMLGLDALRRGLGATLYTFNLRFLDPSWFFPARIAGLEEKLSEQVAIHQGEKRNLAARHYLEFVQAGGDLRMEDLSPELIVRYLSKGLPVITGLSSTWLYHSRREHPVTCEEDDVHGHPAGHFVVLNGYDPTTREVRVSDPYEYSAENGRSYPVPIVRLANAVLLGILTYDANLLIIHPDPDLLHAL